MLLVFRHILQVVNRLLFCSFAIKCFIGSLIVNNVFGTFSQIICQRVKLRAKLKMKVKSSGTSWRSHSLWLGKLNGVRLWRACRGRIAGRAAAVRPRHRPAPHDCTTPRPHSEHQIVLTSTLVCWNSELFRDYELLEIIWPITVSD